MCGRLRVGKAFSRCRGWSEQPCVRPLDAVHMTAGHNALRGSGPGQKRAFSRCSGTSGLSRSPDRPALHYVLFVLCSQYLDRRFRFRPRKQAARTSVRRHRLVVTVHICRELELVRVRYAPDWYPTPHPDCRHAVRLRWSIRMCHCDPF